MRRTLRAPGLDLLEQRLVGVFFAQPQPPLRSFLQQGFGDDAGDGRYRHWQDTLAGQ